MAILSYLSPVGWLLAYLLQFGEKHSLVVYHLRQSLGLHLIAIALFPVRILFFQIPYGEAVRALVDLTWAALLLAAFQGALQAYRRRERPLPLIGEFIQEYLRALS